MWNAHGDLQHRAAGDEASQPLWRIEREDAPVIHDGDAVAESVRLIHIVRRQHDGHALVVERADTLPEEEARLWVQIVGRLIEEQRVGIVHQRPRQQHTLLHASREDAQLLLRPRAEAELFEQLLALAPRAPCAPRHDRRRDRSDISPTRRLRSRFERCGVTAIRCSDADGIFGDIQS